MTHSNRAILLIEDSFERLQWFAQELGTVKNISVYLARDAREAIDLLQEHKFDLVFFDHDLGDAFEDSSWILNMMLWGAEQEKFKIPTHAVIHSSNTVGVANIDSKLRSLGVMTQIVPFENLKQSTNLKQIIEAL